MNNVNFCESYSLHVVDEQSVIDDLNRRMESIQKTFSRIPKASRKPFEHFYTLIVIMAGTKVRTFGTFEGFATFERFPAPSNLRHHTHFRFAHVQ